MIKCNDFSTSILLCCLLRCCVCLLSCLTRMKDLCLHVHISVLMLFISFPFWMILPMYFKWFCILNNHLSLLCYFSVMKDSNKTLTADKEELEPQLQEVKAALEAERIEVNRLKTLLDAERKKVRELMSVCGCVCAVSLFRNMCCNQAVYAAF